MSGWSTVGSWVTAGLGYAGNFVGSTIRNTLVIASNVLPDAGVFGSLGDALGNALSVGAPFSGGGGGGSVLNLFSSDTKKPWNPVAGMDWAGSRLSLGGAEPIRLSEPASPAAEGAAPGSDSPSSDAKKPPSSEDPLRLMTVKPVAPPSPRTPTSSFSELALGSEERATAVGGRADSLLTQGSSLIRSDMTETDAVKVREALAELRTNRDSLNAGLDLVQKNAVVARLEESISVLERTTGKPNPASATAAAVWNQQIAAKVNSGELSGASPILAEKAASLPEVRQYNWKLDHVRKTVEELQPRVEAAIAEGGMTPELSMEIQSLSQVVAGLEESRVRLGAMTYRDGWHRRNVLTGEDAGVDLDYLSTWAGLITPVALAGLQYYAQERADKKNARYLAREKEKDREFEREMTRARLDAQLQVAGINAGAAESGRATVGASRPHTFNAGTYGA